MNWPFRNKFLSKFYATSSIFFEVEISLAFLWRFSDNFADTDFFYTWMLLSLVFTGILL